MEEGDHKHSMMWLDEDEEEYETQQQASGQGSAAAQPSAEEALRVLEEELERTKKELADVRKDLAAKVDRPTFVCSRAEVLMLIGQWW